MQSLVNMCSSFHIEVGLWLGNVFVPDSPACTLAGVCGVRPLCNYVCSEDKILLVAQLFLLYF